MIRKLPCFLSLLAWALATAAAEPPATGAVQVDFGLSNGTALVLFLAVTAVVWWALTRQVRPAEPHGHTHHGHGSPTEPQPIPHGDPSASHSPTQL